MEKEILSPDYLFEVSWEVCHKIGGIHTVITSKAEKAVSKYQNYIVIGPDFKFEGEEDKEFIEDTNLLKDWKQTLADKEGIKVRIGRWNINEKPITILVDHSKFISEKDQIFGRLWERYFLDSLTNDWGYIEPCLFGYAAGAVIHGICKHFCKDDSTVVAQFHEWMSASGILYLKENAPEIANVFTTHSTVTGRSLANAGKQFYKELESYVGETEAKNMGVTTKHSLEKSAAFNADCFTAVSEVTGRECQFIIKKNPNIITPNGFKKLDIPQGEAYFEAKKASKELLKSVAEKVVGHTLKEDYFYIATGGRLEFHNKGYDTFIDALALLNKSKLDKKILAFIFVPDSIYGPRKDIIGTGCANDNCSKKFKTHEIHNVNENQILNKIESCGFENKVNDNVTIVYVPSYLNGDDGIFNKTYYELLMGCDQTVFPSYYEAWGYTPVESLALNVPTISTNVAGFGKWIDGMKNISKDAIDILFRDDFNYIPFVEKLAEVIKSKLLRTHEQELKNIESSQAIYKLCLWDNQHKKYEESYNFALLKAKNKGKKIIRNQNNQNMATNLNKNRHNKPQWMGMIVQSSFPDSLKELNDLASNIWWTWNYEAKELFEEIDSHLWNKFKNPIKVLKEISFNRLQELEKNEEFMFKFNWVVKKFRNYLGEKTEAGSARIAYFSMEYGLDDYLKIFSGGLGILAGDYLKEASDTNTNLVAVGFLYKYGYFKQKMSLDGDQLAIYNPQNPSELPIFPVNDADGNPVTVKVGYPGRQIAARIWLVMVGRVKLYLLDTDINENNEEDRNLSSALYGGNNEHRLKQEMMLGIGGIRTLEAVGEKPDIYHCNEGHAAFINIERLRKLIKHTKLTFQEALELVRTSCLYTTHTPVPAGHDSFPEDLMMTYLGQFPERLQLSWNEFMNLGRHTPDNHGENFSMSNLAIATSQEVNGVSRLHGDVSKEMFRGLWEGYFTSESHVGYVTNGVHYGTWTSKEWQQLHEKTFGDAYLKDMSNHVYWNKIHDVKDELIWDICNKHREQLISYVKQQLHDSWTQRYEDPKKLLSIFKSINKDTLTIGFARRFATYKRAYLLFSNLEKLAKIVNNPERPVQFIFAGKAHPNDKPGQGVIKEIIRISKLPEFVGKVIFLEDYDMALAKRLVQGVDVWMNTPTRPLEASGTSGMKAQMNGTLNFSVLDGWWCEGYKEKAGWALPEEKTYDDDEFQNRLDAETIYSILEYEIVPSFYNRDMQGVPHDWIRYIKKSIAEIAPEFTTKRMIDDYKSRFYTKLAARTAEMKKGDNAMAKDLAAWKRKISDIWDDISVVSMNFPQYNQNTIMLGNQYHGEVVLDTKGLQASEIGIEMVVTDKTDKGETIVLERNEMTVTKQTGNTAVYSIDIKPSKAGIFNYGLRMYPKNSNIPHRQDFAFVRWL